MDFFEFVLAISITVALPLVIFKSILDYKKEKVRAAAGTRTDSGLSVGELKQILREVIEEANAPLVERLDDVGRVLAPPSSGDALEDEFDDEEPQARTVGRRGREAQA